MHAARITRHGAPPELTDAAPASRGPGARVATTVAPLTPLDLLCATGTSYFGAPALPYVPGVQGVGVVLAAESLPAGTRVWFPTTAGMAPGDGSLAAETLVAEEDLVPLPAGVDDAVVAALGLSGVAALMALTWRGGLVEGETVLVLGAGGVVGQAAVQLARMRGAARVVAATRSESGCALATTYGADATVILEESASVPELTAAMSAAAAGPVNLVVDPLCGRAGTAALETLGEGGRLVQLGGSAGPTAELSSATVRSRSLTILGYTNNALSRTQRREALGVLLDHAVGDGLTARHEVVGWDALPDAWVRQDAGTAAARIVVRLPERD